jgi:hypothetical protein
VESKFHIQAKLVHPFHELPRVAKLPEFCRLGVVGTLLNPEDLDGLLCFIRKPNTATKDRIHQEKVLDNKITAGRRATKNGEIELVQDALMMGLGGGAQSGQSQVPSGTAAKMGAEAEGVVAPVAIARAARHGRRLIGD